MCLLIHWFYCLKRITWKGYFTSTITHPPLPTPQGRFTIAAKHHISIAEVYESELVDIEKAIAHYEQAAEYYKGEESNRYCFHYLLPGSALFLVSSPLKKTFYLKYLTYRVLTGF